MTANSIHTLIDLSMFIRTRGYHWSRTIQGIGERQAVRISQFLHSVEDGGALSLPSTSLVRPRDVPIENRPALASYGLRPLEHLLVPSHLLGVDGIFRSNQDDALRAHDDKQALISCFLYYKDRGHTYRSYRKEVERFFLFCVVALKKPLSSIDSMDCIQYRDFLRSIPTSWINPMPCSRDRLEWCPFRGASKTSIGYRSGPFRGTAQCKLHRGQSNESGFKEI